MSAAIEELAVPWDPTKAQERLTRRRRMLISRLISLAITVAVVIGLYLWQRREAEGPALLVISAVVVAISLAWVVGSAIGYRWARRERAEVGEGLALRVGRPGIELAGLFAPWPDVAELTAVRGRVGASPRLRLTTTSGTQASVAWDQIDLYPATLDSAVRAYSAGRTGVDLTALDA